MKKLNAHIVIIPLLLVALLAGLVLTFPTTSTNIISFLRQSICNELTSYYLLFGLAMLGLLVYIAVSKRGDIKLGDEKPMNTLTWGSLIFTSTMAADILFYSFHEWTYYYNQSMLLERRVEQSEKLLWSSTYPLFHWGFIPWAFYLILAVCYAYMFYKKRVTRQNISEACRPVLGKQSDKFIGKAINVIAVIGLICGTSTTFSVATPLITSIICKVFSIDNTQIISVVTLLIIAVIYTFAVLVKNGINVVAKFTTLAFSFLLAMFFIFGNPRFILENGLQGLGNMLQNFLTLSTWTSPTRQSTFVQDWTIFYWAYWIAWCVATPFFIAKISKGRTIRQTIVGGMIAGLLGTFSSFIVFGGFGMHAQAKGMFDMAACIDSGMSAADTIVELIYTTTKSNASLIVVLITMIGLYASTFDALTDVISAFSYKRLNINSSASVRVKLFWALTFIVLPCALLFSDVATQNLMSISIIAALPLTIIMALVVASFIKDSKKNSHKTVYF